MIYELNEDYPDDDPGNKLRQYLNSVQVPPISERMLGEMIYTANERHISLDGLSMEEAILGWKLVELTRSSPVKHDEIRM